MTRQKKLKKAIRARSRKTGESYTAARRHLLATRRRKAGGSAPPRAAAATLVEKTGHDLAHWFSVLDAFDVKRKGHTAAATHLYEAGVPGWHAQMVTVAYERARGLRAMNQSSAGDFQVSVTKSMPASVAAVADALGRREGRRAWLRGADPGLAKALNEAFEGPKARQVKVKSPTLAGLRYRWAPGTVEIHVIGKPKGGSSVVAACTGLDRAELVEERRAQWKAAFEALKAHLRR